MVFLYVHPQNFSLCSENSGNYVYAKNREKLYRLFCRLAHQGSPTVFLEVNALHITWLFFFAASMSPWSKVRRRHICHAETWIQATRGQECIKLSFISPINQLSILFPHIFVIIQQCFSVIALHKHHTFYSHLYGWKAQTMTVFDLNLRVTFSIL